MKVAVISNPLIDKLGPGDFFYNGFKEVCEAVKFNTGEETEGFDRYYYVDDGPSYYDAPKYHPAAYLAIDFVVPHVWFVNSPEVYMNRMRNFDQTFVFSKATQEYCHKNILNTLLIGFAADPNYHKHYDVPVDWDWIAIWHNCENRPYAVDDALAKYPNGRVCWIGNGPRWQGEHDYAWHMSTARCALNYPRANIVNMRVYEVMAIGIPLITMRVEDMPVFGFVENEHYLGFDTNEEMVDKIGWVQGHLNEAQDMAQRAKEWVLKHHTYRQRALDMLEML